MKWRQSRKTRNIMGTMEYNVASHFTVWMKGFSSSQSRTPSWQYLHEVYLSSQLKISHCIVLSLEIPFKVKEQNPRCFDFIITSNPGDLWRHHTISAINKKLRNAPDVLPGGTLHTGRGGKESGSRLAVNPMNDSSKTLGKICLLFG